MKLLLVLLLFVSTMAFAAEKQGRVDWVKETRDSQVGRPNGKDGDGLLYCLKLSRLMQDEDIDHLIVTWMYWMEDSRTGEFIAGYRVGILFADEHDQVFIVDNCCDKPYVVGTTESKPAIMLKGYDVAFSKLLSIQLISAEKSFPTR